jgi:hydrogenase expression/formation protein HypE
MEGLLMRENSILDLINGTVDLTHGSGGKASHQLINEIFAPHFKNEWLDQGNDQAIFEIKNSGKFAMSTDAHVISPLFFPGGNIGPLALHGTINDLAMGGAWPLYLTVSFIIEEGFPLKDLYEIARSMGAASKSASVPIITGDTKVVEKGKGDGVFISVSGLGAVHPNPEIKLSGDRARSGDKVILSGTMGDHGMAILATREGLTFKTELKSDQAPLHELVKLMLDHIPQISLMRDPTRGGVAATLNEICQQSDIGIILDEKNIPIKKEVRGACELLGLDPLHVANEGKLLAVVPAVYAEKLISIMHSHPYGVDAAIIGEVREDKNNFLQMKTTFGGNRIVHWMSSEQLPRIC